MRIPFRQRQGVCLDAVELRTTKTWISGKLLKENRIHVVENNPKVHEEQVKQFAKAKRNCSPRFHSKTMNKFLFSPVSTNINVAFFDYLGSFFGNRQENLFPQQDLYQFLRRNKAKRLTIAFTVSLRGDSYECEKLEETVKEIFLTNLIGSSTYELVGVPKYHIYKRTRKSGRRKTRSGQRMLMVCCNLVRNKNKIMDPNSNLWLLDNETGFWQGFSENWKEEDANADADSESSEEDSEIEEEDSEIEEDNHFCKNVFVDDLIADPDWVK